MEIIGVIVYFVVKLAAYSWWCARAKNEFKNLAPLSSKPAIVHGLVRLFMGFGFGAVIFLTSVFLVAGLSEIGVASYSLASFVAYILIYVPIRWVEWTLMERIIVKRKMKLFNQDRISTKWRIWGIAISCLADLPIIIAQGGIIIGRINC